MSIRIERCRLSGSPNLSPVLDLGEQAFTGIFPASGTVPVPRGSLELLWCGDSGLLQLAHSFDRRVMYGDNYGYRSGLNVSMVRHLRTKATRLARQVSLGVGDLVLDIGSNDGTLLAALDIPGVTRIGMDPTIAKFARYYPPEVLAYPTFFSRTGFEQVAGATQRARLITSIAMFYDLDDPVGFARDIHACLADDGLWHFEQSYMPSMLRATAYDTVCHEHIAYYSLSCVTRILAAADLEVVDVELNDVNGGSFAVSARKATRGAGHSNCDAATRLLEDERRLGLDSLEPFRQFAARVDRHRERLVDMVRGLRRQGRLVLGYGASTKGNVVLQYCGLTSDDLPCIADVNPDKHGCVTPGTGIPIVSEADARQLRPDYLLVLPWHFREAILERERDFLAGGGRMIFPLPEIEIV